MIKPSFNLASYQLIWDKFTFFIMKTKIILYKFLFYASKFLLNLYLVILIILDINMQKPTSVYLCIYMRNQFQTYFLLYETQDTVLFLDLLKTRFCPQLRSRGNFVMGDQPILFCPLLTQRNNIQRGESSTTAHLTLDDFALLRLANRNICLCQSLKCKYNDANKQ